MGVTTRARWGATATVVVLVAVVVVSAAPAGAAPVATVTPGGSLHDGQVIQVDVSGLLPDTTMPVAECTPEAHCRIITSLTADGAGAATVAMVAHAFIRTNGGSNAIFQPGPCDGGCFVLIGTNSIFASAPLTFDPPDPMPTPVPTVTPSTGLRDAQTVAVHVVPGYFDLGQSVTVGECAGPLPADGGLAGPCGPATVATASTADGSVSTSFTVHRADPVSGLDCAVRACALAVRGQRFDVTQATITFVALSVAPTTTSPVATVAPITAATPAFTG